MISADEADAYRRAVALNPQAAEPHYNLGVILGRQGRLDEAASSYERALVLRPDHAEAHNNLGIVRRAQGRYGEAETSFRNALAARPNHAKAHYNLGVTLQHQGRLEEAAASYRSAIAIKPDYAEAHYNLALQLPMDGASPDADAAFALLSQQLGQLDQFQPMQRAMLLFALGKAQESRGEFDLAFSSLARANTLHRAVRPFDIVEAERLTASIAGSFDGALFERLRNGGAASDRPIFIVGMPRSGTTLIEQILSAHPEVHGAGEIPTLESLVIRQGERRGAAYPSWARNLTPGERHDLGQAYLDALPAAPGGETRIVDKTLLNFRHLGLIHLCLPNAIIIHCRRDPRDACFSCFATRFGDGQDYAYELTELGRYWRAYDELMAHWRAALPPGRMLEVPYEAVIQDVEAWSRRLVAHCGLEWDDACLRFYESQRDVRTASFAQVRQPIYASSVGRWRRFEHHLGPLVEALGEPWKTETPSGALEGDTE